MLQLVQSAKLPSGPSNLFKVLPAAVLRGPIQQTPTCALRGAACRAVPLAKAKSLSGKHALRMKSTRRPSLVKTRVTKGLETLPAHAFVMPMMRARLLCHYRHRTTTAAATAAQRPTFHRATVPSPHILFLALEQQQQPLKKLTLLRAMMGYTLCAACKKMT